MAAFQRASNERINAFRVDGEVLFRHYFEPDAVFDQLRDYYDREHYRFVVPPAEFESVQSFLANRGYGLVLVDVLEPFVVVCRQYSEHPEVVLENRVAKRTVDGHNVFLLSDREAVDRAAERGANRLEDTGLQSPF